MINRGLILVSALALGAVTAHAENMISADSIKAGKSSVTVGSVKADKAGYIVVHRTDVTGKLPGPVVGHAPIKAGENANVMITLEKPAEPGSKLIVMLHEEGNNDTKFDAADKPVKSGGHVVQQIVTVQ